MITAVFFLYKLINTDGISWKNQKEIQNKSIKLQLSVLIFSGDIFLRNLTINIDNITVLLYTSLYSAITTEFAKMVSAKNPFFLKNLQ